MSPVATELLRVQKKQFETALLWIGIINNPEVTPEDKKTAVKNYVELLAMIQEVQFETLGLNLQTYILND